MNYEEKEALKRELRKEIDCYKDRRCSDMYKLFREKLLAIEEKVYNASRRYEVSWILNETEAILSCFSIVQLKDICKVIDAIRSKIYETDFDTLIDKLNSLLSLIDEIITKKEQEEAAEVVKIIFLKCAEHADEIVKIIGAKEIIEKMDVKKF